nr:hypothetical protein DGKKSRWO_DGKKSRWO_CDS_0062 [uncultured phage]CAI9752224.1 hypothetical protein CVNMHQAP_CVNMHQAP_CDS_0062 [uncultured phage]
MLSTISQTSLSLGGQLMVIAMIAMISILAKRQLCC